MMHQEVSLNETEGSLNIPLGSTLSFRYRSKLTGKETIAKIHAGSAPNYFFALFDEDDVDFRIVMENSSADRSVCFDMRILDESHVFVTFPNKTDEIETLESNGKKLHFIRQCGHEGKKLVSTTATSHGLSTHEASVMLSEIKFQVSYSEREKYLITARIGNGKTISIAVNGSSTLAYLKKIIALKAKVFAEQFIHFKGIRLDDNDKTMENLGITEHSVVDVTGETIVYNIKVLPGKTVPVATSSNATTIQLKTEIAKQEGIPIDQQRLYCDGGRELHDNCRPYRYLRRNSDPTIFLFTNWNNDSTGSMDVSECSSSSVFVVNVIHPNGQLVTVSVCALDTIQELIRKVQVVVYVAMTDDIQCYKKNKRENRRLEKFLPLMVYNISEKTEECTLHLRIVCTEKLHICTPQQNFFIKKLGGNAFSIPYCGMLSIQEIKRRIREREGIPEYQQVLVLPGTQIQLEDGSTLRDYGVQMDSTIHLVLKLRGGGRECLEHKLSERGAITFGGESEQQFREVDFDEDDSIQIVPFVVELRLAAVPLL